MENELRAALNRMNTKNPALGAPYGLSEPQILTEDFYVRFARLYGKSRSGLWGYANMMADDERIKRTVEEHQRDYRASHNASLESEITAFEEWRDRANGDDVLLSIEARRLANEITSR